MNKSILTYIAEAVDRYRADRRATTSERETRSEQPSRLRRFLRWLTPNGGTLLLVAALIVTAQVWAKPLTSPANTPGPSATTVNYQGRLADSGGVPLDGSYGMSFALWDAATGGSVVWGPESHTAVPVSEGLFSVGLGSQTGGGISTNVWDGDRYLEITVGGETLSPRELIRSVPIAGMALTLPDGVVDGAMLAEIGFGSSNVALSNFVSRGPVVEADLISTLEAEDAVWDLRPIVGNSAEVVVLQVWLDDAGANSRFQAWPNGVSQNRTNAPFARTASSWSVSEILWVRCDNEQKIQYDIASNDGDDVLQGVQVTVIGWIEPATTP